MKIINKLLLVGLNSLILACGNPSNELPSEERNDELETRIDELSKEVTQVSSNDRYQEQGARLTHETVGETNTYLNTLYKNINSTRVEHLPEWQEMYTALTQPEAMEDPNFGLGSRNTQTNFHTLHNATQNNHASIEDVNKRVEANSAALTTQATTLQTIANRLETIDNNITDLNRVVDLKHKQVDKLLQDFEGRIVGIENRMDTMEKDLDLFRSEFGAYKQKVENIERQLSRYKLATMFNDIRNLKKVTENHETRIIDLDGRVNTNMAEIDNNRADIESVSFEVSEISSETRTLRVQTDQILNELQIQ